MTCLKQAAVGIWECFDNAVPLREAVTALLLRLGDDLPDHQLEALRFDKRLATAADNKQVKGAEKADMSIDKLAMMLAVRWRAEQGKSSSSTVDPLAKECLKKNVNAMFHQFVGASAPLY